MENVTGVCVYRLKVTLRGLRPPVWRRFLVRDDDNLADLHQHLQQVLGWGDGHAHAFRTDDGMYMAAHLADSCECEDESSVRLRDVLRRAAEVIAYDYDFGDGWSHVVKLERIEPLVLDHPYPWVLAGRNACPPDDVGGAGGYREFLEAIADYAHPEHEEMRAWFGGPFDPSAYDASAVNRAIHGAWTPPKRAGGRRMPVPPPRPGQP